MLEMIPLGRLGLSDDNPRRQGAGDLTGLKASILADGVLQNLIVYPAPDVAGEPAYLVAAGGRRWRALFELFGEGKLALDYLVPCRIEESFDAAKALAENVIREPMHPIDEFDAFARVAGLRGIDGVMAAFGVSRRYVEQRMKIAELSKPLRKAARLGEISMAEAFAIALHPKKDHQGLINQCIGNDRDLAARIRADGHAAKIPVEAALFDRALYTGPIEKDLFAEEGSGEFFVDKAAFMALQRPAAEALVEKLAKEHGYKAGLVTAGYEELRGKGYEPCYYNETRTSKKKLTYVRFLSDDGELREPGTGTDWKDPDEVAKANAKTEKEEASIKEHNKAVTKEIREQKMERYAIDARFSFSNRDWVAGIKTRVLQYHMASSPIWAMRWMVMQLALDLFGMGATIKLEQSGPAEVDVLPLTQEMQDRWDWVRANLGLNADDHLRYGDYMPAGQLRRIQLWDRIKGLPETDLPEMLAVMITGSIGTRGDHTREKTSLIDIIGQDMGVEVEKYWRPTKDFLEVMTKGQLVDELSGVVGERAAKYLTSGKKEENAKGIAKLFEQPERVQKFALGGTGAELVPKDVRKAIASWLPKGMGFWERTRTEILAALQPPPPKEKKPAKAKGAAKPRRKPKVIEQPEGEDVGLPDVPETGEIYPMAAE
jgi:ParB/RepB/Spo0J family partition protein